MKNIPLWARVMIGMFLGIIAGFVLGPEITTYFKPIGQIFINAIQMLVVPLVLSTLICGVAGMSDPASMGRIGVKTLIALVLFTAVSTSLGLGIANLVLGKGRAGKEAVTLSESKKEDKSKYVKGKVGIRISSIDLNDVKQLEKTNPDLAEKLTDVLSGSKVSAEIVLPESMLGTADEVNDKDSDSLSQILKNIIPSNPFASMSKGNILQIIVFALFLGICICMIKEKGRPLYNFFDSLAEAMFVMVNGVMSVAPFGVFFLMAWVTSNFGVDTLKDLALVVVAVYN